MKSNKLPFAALAALTVFTAGCASSSSSYEKAGKTSTSLQETAFKIDKGEVQIDTALLALSDLVNAPNQNIKPQFKKFESAVGKLDSLSKDVSKQALAMQEQGAAYFQQWDTDLAKIQNEDIRSRSTERKNIVAARFDRVRASYAHAKDAFVPFMSRLSDVRTALSADLTGEGLTSVKSIADDAKANAVPLREALRQLSADFRVLGLSLSSSSK
jgi:seryl-tRNA synthetase